MRARARLDRAGCGGLAFVCGLALALTLGGCAPAAVKPQKDRPLVWPDPPDAPRIEFVGAFTRPEDFGIGKGFFQRLTELVLGATDVRMVRPMAVLAVNGVVYVADPGVKGVHRFDQSNGSYELVLGDGQAPLPSPVGLARGADGEVYVSDSVLAKVLVIRPGAKTATPLDLPKMGQPTGIAFDPGNRRLFVVDTTAHRVNVFNGDGTLYAAFGRRGDGDGEFNYPTQIWRDHLGRLFVTDSLNFRIQMLDEQGRFLGKFGQAGDATGDFMRHKGVATDRHGHVYVVDALAGAFQIFDLTGRLLLSIGELGSGRGEFWLPTGIFVSEDDMIYIADSFNRRIQEFRMLEVSP